MRLPLTVDAFSAVMSAGKTKMMLVMTMVIKIKIVTGALGSAVI